MQWSSYAKSVSFCIKKGNLSKYLDSASDSISMKAKPQQLLSNSEHNTEHISLVSRIARLVLQSSEPELEKILATTATEVRNLLDTDRVKVYKFHADQSGQVVAESLKENNLPSLLGLNFPADDIPDHVRNLYIESRACSVIDVTTQRIGFNIKKSPSSPGDESENLYYRPINPCHLEYLTAMGVKFSMVIPILINDQLWGLLVSHHRESLDIPRWQLEEVQEAVNHLSVAIAQAHLLAQAREKGQQEATINAIVTYFGSLPDLDLQKPLEKTVKAFGGSGGRLYITPSAFEVKPLLNGHSPSLLEQSNPDHESYRLLVTGDQPTIPEHFMYPVMEQYSCWSQYFHSGEHQIWSITDLYQNPKLRNLQPAFESTKIRGILVVPLRYDGQIVGFLSVFRDEVDTETLWAGEFDPDVRQEQPRQSFKLWKQLKKGQIEHWTESDAQMLQTLGSRFSSAIQQHEMYQQVHKLNSSLEKQVEERTTKLRQAKKQQQVLFDVVTKMRDSLDLETIFATMSREVRTALAADRVGIYRFDPLSKFNEGELVAEDVISDYPVALGAKVKDHCFGENYANLYTQGRINTLNDIHGAGLKDCYVAVLDQFQIKASLTAPVLKGEQLWGLLCIHQCSQPRHWQESEIQFAREIASQVSIALEQADLLAKTKKSAEQEQALFEIVTKIRQSLNLETIFATMSEEVRKTLEADRVGIYRFDPQSAFNEGEFVAEDVNSEYRLALGAKVKDHCFGENYASLYTQGKINALNDIHEAGLKDCYVAVLDQFQIKASLTAPVLKGKELWGLLCIHQCSQPRHWQESEIQFARQIASQVSIALEQADLLTKTKKSAEQRQTLFEVVGRIRASLNINHIFQTTTEEIGRLLQADRVVIYRFNPDWSGEFVAEYLTEGWISLMEKQLSSPELKQNVSECSAKLLAEVPKQPLADTYLQDTEGGEFARGKTFRVCEDIHQANFDECYLKALESYQARSYAIVAIYQGEKLWGLIAVYQNSAPRHWQPSEINFLEQIAAHLGVATHQAYLLAQTQKSAEQQKTLFEVVTKIRQSLDLEVIFKVTTKEIRQLLQAERVTLYKFNSDWGGKFLNSFESSAPEWQDVGRMGEDLVWDDTYLQENQGGCYRQNETFSVSDVHQGNLTQCHVEILDQFQIKAFATAPIFVGQQLWGIMAAYQHSTTRNWTDLEINFLAHTAAQLGVAIQQSDLLSQTQDQAQELQNTLQELKETQTQLIQTEKMSSLGQLVAGIAHEINNPVNFIHGNVIYAGEYVEELLKLVSLYQKHYPEPTSEIAQLAEAIDPEFLSEDLHNLLASMKVGTERIKQIIVSLLSFSHLDQANLKPVNIHEGIDSSLLILHHRLKGKPGRQEIAIVQEYGDVPLVECYAGQLNQVFMNLLSNSIYALDDHAQSQPNTYVPQIKISTDVIKNDGNISGVGIVIVDNGSGIPEKVQAKMFEPFFTTKPVGKGTGLGLSISYQIIVDKHGGSMRCESQPGEGTKFYLEIPLEQVSQKSGVRR